MIHQVPSLNFVTLFCFPDGRASMFERDNHLFERALVGQEMLSVINIKLTKSLVTTWIFKYLLILPDKSYAKLNNSKHSMTHYNNIAPLGELTFPTTWSHCLPRSPHSQNRGVDFNKRTVMNHFYSLQKDIRFGHNISSCLLSFSFIGHILT